MNSNIEESKLKDLSDSALRLWIEYVRVLDCDDEGFVGEVIISLQNDASEPWPTEKCQDVVVCLSCVYRPWLIEGLDDPINCDEVGSLALNVTNRLDSTLRDGSVSLADLTEEDNLYTIKYEIKFPSHPDLFDMSDWALRLVHLNKETNQFIWGTETEPGVINTTLVPSKHRVQASRRILGLQSMQQPISIWEDPVRLKEGFTGCQVWDSSLALAGKLDQVDVNRKLVLDMGTGTGFAGICAGLLGGECVLSDLPSMLPLANKNVQEYRSKVANEGGCIQVEPLEWDNPDDESELLTEMEDRKFQIVLGSDVAYNEAGGEKFIRSLIRLTEESSKLVLAYRQRSAVEQHFFHKLSEWFELQPDLHWDSIPGFPNVFVSVFRKRKTPESITCSYCLARAHEPSTSATAISCQEVQGTRTLQIRSSVEFIQKHHVEDVIALNWDGKLISGSCDTTLRLWDVESGSSTELTGANNPHLESISNICALDAAHYITADFNGQCALWSFKSSTLAILSTCQIDSSLGGIESLSVGSNASSAQVPNSVNAMLGCDGGAVVALAITWSDVDGSIAVIGSSIDHKSKGAFQAYVVWAGEDRWLSGGAGGTLIHWKVDEHELRSITKSQILDCGITFLRFDHTSKLLVATGDSGVVAVVSNAKESNVTVSKLSGHVSSAEHACWLSFPLDSSSKRLATCSTDSKVLLWSVETTGLDINAEIVGTCPHPEGVTIVATQPGCSWFVSACLDGQLRAWDAVDSSLLCTVPISPIPIVTMTFRHHVKILDTNQSFRLHTSSEGQESEVDILAVGLEDGAVAVVKFGVSGS